MRVLYGCYTGVHTSLLAAAYHLGWFDSKLSFRECRKKMNEYGSLTYKDIGKPLLWGLDEQKREVYTIGLAMERKIFSQAVHALFGIYNYTGQDYYFVDTSDYGGNLVALGSKVSGFRLLRPWGEALIEKSLDRNQHSIARLVQHTKAYLNSM